LLTSREKESWERINPYRVSVAPTLKTIDDFVAAVVCNDSGIINHALWEARQTPSTLCSLFQAIANVLSPAPECRIAFHSAWINQGLWIRDEFSVDPLLPAALANLLPGYSGPPVELFRGERWSNHEARTYGPSWSSKLSIAGMFGSGLNRCPQTGGVVLRILAPEHAILAGPTPGLHMAEEAEYIVDRRCLQQVEVIERFPPE
jgi:hypothetical protein